MADRDMDMDTGAGRELAEAAERMKKGLEELSGAQARANDAAIKTVEEHEKLSRRLMGLVAGVGGIAEAFNSSLFKGMERMDVNYSRLTDEYLSGIEKTAREVKRAMGVKVEPPAGAGEELSRSTARTGDTDEAEADKKRKADALQREREFNNARIEGAQNANEIIGNLNKKQDQDETASWNYKLRVAGYTAGAISNTLQNLYAVSGKHNRAMFESMKAFAIAETVIQTYRAAMGSYAALSSIPVIGPALGVAAAAAAIAAGMARVEMIRKTHPEGATGTISEGGAANPPYAGGSPSAYPVPQAMTGPEPRPTQYITINIQNGMGDAAYWQTLVENNIIPAINSAGDRNIKIVVNQM